MMRKKVTMRSVQGEAMHAIQQGESPIVVVMPTGSGKSVLFMLPAFVQVGGVTIVVVPLESIACRYGGSVPRGEHPLRGVGTRTRGRRGIDRVGDTREGGVAGIWHIHQSRQTDATIGSSRYRRVSCHFERPMGFSTRVTTIGQIGVCRDADVVVDGDIAADRRADVVRQDVLAASGSAIDTCIDSAEKHRV